MGAYGFVDTTGKLVIPYQRDWTAISEFTDGLAFVRKDDKYGYNYDYSEYSRQNWCLLNACCKLDEALRQMLILALTDRAALQKIKKAKSPDALNN